MFKKLEVDPCISILKNEIKKSIGIALHWLGLPVIEVGQAYYVFNVVGCSVLSQRIFLHHLANQLIKLISYWSKHCPPKLKAKFWHSLFYSGLASTLRAYHRRRKKTRLWTCFFLLHSFIFLEGGESACNCNWLLLVSHIRPHWCALLSFHTTPKSLCDENIHKYFTSMDLRGVCGLEVELAYLIASHIWYHVSIFQRTHFQSPQITS